MTSMTARYFRSLLISLLLPLMLFSFCGTALAEVVGKLTRVEGAVDIMPGGQLPAVAARDGGPVQKGDFIRTKSNARAEVTFNDGSVIKIAQRSRIDVGEYSGSNRKLGLPRGKVQATVVPAAAGNAPHSFEIRTPNAIAGVRGTSFYVYHQGNITGVAVTQGIVHTASLGQPLQGVTLVAGTGTTVARGHAPAPARPISERELNSHRDDVSHAAPPGAPSGTGSAATGDGSTASGTGSATTGDGSAASGNGSTASGNGSTATGGQGGSTSGSSSAAASGSPSEAASGVPAIVASAIPTLGTAATSGTASSAIESSTLGSSATGSAATTNAASALGTSLQAVTVTPINSTPVVTVQLPTVNPPVTETIPVTPTPTPDPTPAPTPDPTPAPTPDPTPTPTPDPTPTPTPDPTPTPTPDPKPTPTPTPTPLFSSQVVAGLMSRSASVDPNSNLLTIISDPGLTLTLSGTTSLWTGNAQATLAGLYPTLPLQQPNHYWLGKLYSDSTANHTTTDGGAYYGYFGGMTLDGANVSDTTINALYIDPTGKTGIMHGALPGTITASGLSGAGTLTLTEMPPVVSGLNPASFSANWWDSKTGSTVVEVNAPVLTDFGGSAGGNKRKDSEGFMLDGFNITSQMSNRGDVLRLGYLGADPSFGIWSRESFGTYNGSAAEFALISNATWGTLNADSSFSTDREIKLISIGKWQSDGMLTGTADGVWGELSTGGIKLLTGTLSGSSNLGASSFGAVTTGSFIDLSRFLAIPSLASALGFPTLKSPVSFNLSGTSASGSVTVGNVSFYSRNATDPVSLWVAQNVSGSYTGGLQQQNFSLMNGASAGTSTILGTMRISDASATTGTWLGSINAIGEIGTSFRSEFDGVATGSFNGATFTGSAAGLSHPVTYYSAISGGAITRYDSGSAVSYGSIDGVMGGMSLWGSTPGMTSDFKGVGFFTQNQATTAGDFVLNAPIQSKDIPNNTAMTADGGAYWGHLVAGVTVMGGAPTGGTTTGGTTTGGTTTGGTTTGGTTTGGTTTGGTTTGGTTTGGTTTGGGPGTPGIIGVMNALSIDPAGNAGVLHGKFSGYLDPMKVWMTEGNIFPVTLAASTGVTAANLNAGSGVSTITTPFYAGGTSFNGTPGLSGWVPDAFTRSYIASSPDWGIGQFGLYAGYSVAPASTTPWNIDFAITDALSATTSLVGTMAGSPWDPASGRLSANTRAGWHDMLTAQVAATPMTGIFIGETVGTFNPASLQAMTSGIWLETRKFLGLAATAAGQATLQKLNIPAVEVGKADFSGSNGNFDVIIKDLRFFAPVSGGRPQIFATDNITGNYSVPFPSGSAVLNQVPGVGVATSGISPTFNISQWDAINNKWSAALTYNGASGVVAGNGNIQLTGTAAGRISGGSTGTFSGTGAGVVR